VDNLEIHRPAVDIGAAADYFSTAIATIQNNVYIQRRLGRA
jgi:hypothetical protein